MSTHMSRTYTTEYVAGLPPTRIVQCHGGFRSASCIVCREACSSAWYRDEIEADRIPRCTRRDGNDGEACGGLCKADITFFGEALPAEFGARKKQVKTRMHDYWDPSISLSKRECITISLSKRECITISLSKKTCTMHFASRSPSRT